MPGYLAEHQESPRVKGFREGLTENGIEFREEFILNRKGKGTSEQETEELVMNLLRNGTKVNGIITSIDRNPALLAKKACEILLDEIEGKEVQTENVIEVSLIERDSTR